MYNFANSEIFNLDDDDLFGVDLAPIQSSSISLDDDSLLHWPVTKPSTVVAHSTTLILKLLGHYQYHVSFFIPPDQLPPPRSHLTLIGLYHTFLPISTSRLLQSTICKLYHSHHYCTLIVLMTGATYLVLLICLLFSPPHHSPSGVVE